MYHAKYESQLEISDNNNFLKIIKDKSPETLQENNKNEKIIRLKRNPELN